MRNHRLENIEYIKQLNLISKFKSANTLKYQEYNTKQPLRLLTEYEIQL